jgi:hypothetical protein
METNQRAEKGAPCSYQYRANLHLFESLSLIRIHGHANTYKVSNLACLRADASFTIVR